MGCHSERAPSLTIWSLHFISFILLGSLYKETTAWSDENILNLWFVSDFVKWVWNNGLTVISGFSRSTHFPANVVTISLFHSCFPADSQCKHIVASSQTSYHYSQSASAILKLEVISILAHLAAGFGAGRWDLRDYVSYFLVTSLRVDYPVYMTCSPSHSVRVWKKKDLGLYGLNALYISHMEAMSTHYPSMCQTVCKGAAVHRRPANCFDTGEKWCMIALANLSLSGCQMALA